ncbi:MAG: GNAT family N-acetyltransferase [Actinomycetota bacterium]
MPPDVRFARPQDAERVIALASSMYESMGLDVTRPEWRAEAERMIRERSGGDDCAVFVSEVDGEPVACGGVTLTTRLPGPGVPNARYAYIQWMVTDPAHRRRGHGRAVFEAILAWVRGRGVRNAELHATSEGEPLYRAFGFDDPRYPQLRAGLEG